MPAEFSILAVDWATEQPTARQLPLETRVPSVLIPLRGTTLEYRIEPHASRCCLGHYSYDGGAARYVDCHERLPLTGPRKCTTCSRVDEQFAANMHRAHTRGLADAEPQFRDHLAKPHFLYLAAFRDGTVKIGTSVVYRCRERLAEQGAWLAALIAATPDGLVVRELEAELGPLLGVPQSVSGSRKLHSHAAPLSDADIHDRLASTAQRARTVLVDASDRRVNLREDEWRFPLTDPGLWADLVEYPIDAGSGSHSYEILDMCGKTAVVRPSGVDDRMVIDLNVLLGLPLKTVNVVPDVIQVQGALF